MENAASGQTGAQKGVDSIESESSYTGKIDFDKFRRWDLNDSLLGFCF